MQILDTAWLGAWRRDVEAAAAALMVDFQRRFGYPPGENVISDADPSAARRLASASAPLAQLYEHVGAVSLPDVGNGHFVHPASLVLDQITTADLVVFASDGGGILYATARDGTVHRSVAASPDADFEPVATDLRNFLDQLRTAVLRFVETGEP